MEVVEELLFGDLGVLGVSGELQEALEGALEFPHQVLLGEVKGLDLGVAGGDKGSSHVGEVDSRSESGVDSSPSELYSLISKLI